MQGTAALNSVVVPGYVFSADHLLPWSSLKSTLLKLAGSSSSAAVEDSFTSLQVSLNIAISCGSFNPITEAHVEMLKLALEFLNNSSDDIVYSVTKTEKNTPTRILLGGFVSPVSDGYKKKDLARFEQRRKCCELTFEECEIPIGALTLNGSADHYRKNYACNYFAQNRAVSVDSWEGLQPVFTRTYNVLKHIEAEVISYYKQCIEDDSEIAPNDKKAYESLFMRSIHTFFVCGGDLFETFYHSGVWDLGLLELVFREFNLIVISRIGSGDPLEIMAKHTTPLCHPSSPSVTVDLRNYAHKVHVLKIKENKTSSTQVRVAVRCLQSGKASEEDKNECLKCLDEMVLPAVKKYLLEHKMYR